MLLFRRILTFHDQLLWQVLFSQSCFGVILLIQAQLAHECQEVKLVDSRHFFLATLIGHVYHHVCLFIRQLFFQLDCTELQILCCDDAVVTIFIHSERFFELLLLISTVDVLSHETLKFIPINSARPILVCHLHLLKQLLFVEKDSKRTHGIFQFTYVDVARLVFVK